jgi:hypothetical protein
MRIEFLFHPDCPAWCEALRELSAALRELGIDAELRLVEVREEEEARKLRFPGSPTLRIEGDDLFPMPVPRFGLTCRVYLTEDGPKGYPTRRLIVEALRPRLSREEETDGFLDRTPWGTRGNGDRGRGDRPS